MILSDRTQATIIAAMLAGEQPDIDPADLVGEWREYHDWIVDNGDYATYQEFINQYSARSETDLINVRLVGQARNQPARPDSIDDTLDSLPDLHWLWYGWIPRGQITLLVGDPSAGKSYFTLDLAQRIITGDTMPDGTNPHHTGNILYIDAENRPMVLKQRIEPWNKGQRSRFYYMLPEERRMMINLDYDDDVDRLLDLVYKIRPALIIIDSYGTISLRGENAKEDVQRILALLTRISRDYDCALLIIHHLRKKPQMQLTFPGMETMTLASVRGSGHITAMATNVIGLALAGQDRNGPRLLQVIKNNLGKYPDPIGVTFSAWEQNNDVAILTYGDPPTLADNRPRVEQCLDWLIDFLDANGASDVADIIEEAECEGYNRRMVYRARKRAGIDVKSSRNGPKNGTWELRDYTTDPADEDEKG